MPSSADHTPLRLDRRAIVLAAVLVAAAMPAPVGAAGATGARSGTGAAPVPELQAGAAPPDATPGITESIHYLDTLEHANDVIAFTPGGRVTEGFRPRPSDTWQVGGRAPTALPGGLATGSDMARQRQGSSWAAGPPSGWRDPLTRGAPVDGPTNAAPDAASTSWVAPEPTAPTSSATVGSGLRREVFGFLPYWEVTDSSTTLDWDVLSTVAYFSVGATAAGDLLKTNSDGSTTTGWGGWTSSRMTSIITAAHQHGTRVVLTISCFAWTSGQQTTQAALLDSAAARANLARQIAAAVRDRGADGVNLDFEPIVSGRSAAFTALVRSVRAELDAIAPGYQLTFDTTGWIGNYPLEDATAPGGADAIFIMGYDYRTSSSGQAGSISPLNGPAYDLTDTVAAYSARVSPSKLILGVPYYGRAWSTDTDQLHATNISSTKYGSSVTSVYGTAVALAEENGRRYDALEQSPWTAYQKQTCTTTYGCVTSWRELYYDDAASLKLRYDLINRTGLRGAGIWALGYDGTRPELYQALNDKFVDDTTAPSAGILNLPESSTDLAVTVRWGAADDGTIVNYDVDVSTDGGAWSAWLRSTTATSASWLGTAGHRYAFRVRARDASGNLGAWDSDVGSGPAPTGLTVGGHATVLVSGLKLRAAADPTATVLGTLSPGDVLALTGGPVSAGGYAWYQVTGPITAWGAYVPVAEGSWVAAGSGSTAYLGPRLAPNATVLNPVLDRFAVSGAPRRVLTPDGDGIRDTVDLSWTNTQALSSLTLDLTRPNGTVAGSISLSSKLGAGQQTYRWDGRIGGAVVARGTYLARLRGVAGGTPVAAPGTGTPGAAELAAFAIPVDPVPGATYVALEPTRLVDTRVNTGLSGPLTSTVPRTFAVVGHAGVPSGAVAVTANITAVNPTSAGWLAVTPTPSVMPPTSSLNLPKGDIRANGITVRLSPDGTLSVVFRGAPGATTAFLVDITGYYVTGSAGATYVALEPTRLVDTRVNTGLSGPLTSTVPRTFAVVGHAGVPSGAVAVTANITAVNPTSAGWLAVTPTPSVMPPTSSLNLPKGDIRANGITVRLSPDGTLSVVFRGAPGATTAFLVDITGYWR